MLICDVMANGLLIFEGKSFLFLYCEVGGTGFNVSKVKQSHYSP
jgi:hypothetical protein